MTYRLGLGLLWALLALLAGAPLWLTLPEPGSPPITEASRLVDGQWQPVTLPHASGTRTGWEHYRLVVRPDRENPVYLYIPTVSQRAVIELSGEEIHDSLNRSSMMGLASGVATLAPLPDRLLSRDGNILDIHLQSLSLVPTYLSAVYLGSARQLAPHYRKQVFVLEYLRLLAPASQLLMTLVVLVLWLYRREALFGWLSLLLLSSLFIYLGMLRDLVPNLLKLLPYMHMLGSSSTAILVITLLLIAGRPPPRWLKLLALLLPAACIFLGLAGIVPAMQLVLLVNAPFNIMGLLVGLAIIIWAALAQRLEEAWLLLLPILLAVLAALHDFAMITGYLDGPIFLSLYYRPALMIGIAMILMRRLGVSLNRLDGVNAYLTQRLEEQERELQRLHREERREAAQRTLSDERQRLTADLHDGLSGHLASIIALSERQGSAQVSSAAREALDDLRLVIHSLDIGEGELLVALAGLRDRLERQLRRMNVALEWSMARLPDIAGVTPSHALNVLRILQEAITNAVRHGRATRISILGSPDRDGWARIAVENDGLPFPGDQERGGSGLSNMRRRIDRLGGDMEIEPLPNGTRLTLLLPPRLPGSAANQPDKPVPGPKPT